MPRKDDAMKVNTTAGASRRYIIMLVLGSAIVSICFVGLFRNAAAGTRALDYMREESTAVVTTAPQEQQGEVSSRLDDYSRSGYAIAPRLGNDTLK